MNTLTLIHCILSFTFFQGMHPDLPHVPHMPPPPHMPPSSMSLSRGPPHQMPPHAMGMMGSNNPYGPSGPLPPGMVGQMMPGQGSMGGMGSAPVPQRMPNPLNTIQLQQLSAQIKAYRMLSRSMTPPEALISIVQGRKLTPAMLGSLARGNPAAQPVGMGYQPSGGVPSPVGSSHSAAGGSGTGRDSPAQTNITLYPPSPSTAGPVPLESSTSQLKPASNLMLSVSSPAPNVTLQPGGELPLQVPHYTPTLLFHHFRVDCTCWVCCVALPCCLLDLACFFLPSSSL